MNIQLSAHLACREDDVFVVSHHKLEAFVRFTTFQVRSDWPLQALKPPAVGDAHVGVEVEWSVVRRDSR
jgi:hypothetical protein